MTTFTPKGARGVISKSNSNNLNLLTKFQLEGSETFILKLNSPGQHSAWSCKRNYSGGQGYRAVLKIRG